MGSMGSSGRLSMEENEEEKEEESSKFDMATFEAREEEIERKKMEVKEKIEVQLSQAEEEAKRLTQIWDELEVMVDPMRKEVGFIRKKIDMVNRELKPLGLTCQKKEKEYKEALESFNEKNKEKAQLVTTLVELLTESEKLRTMKLEELTKNLEAKP
ncbi:DNA repair protein RAD50 [Manihot esculenta]|uniref:Uncharacterized protein n=1 Tax=Manihot esculenta TaxID=3983 RepID=A0A2C9VJS7_MANES|nr:DNA repair protein RAD50 [Manihot esculenta]OAY45765.1 hypothetical protein MANES_07G089500v8 [Manihot esculenta]